MLRLFLFAIAILVAALTGLVARRIYVDQATVQGNASLYVGGELVTVERAMIRDPDLRDGGAVNRLDLVFGWPEFRPAGGGIGDSSRSLVFVALEDAAPLRKSKDDIDPAERPIALYARFLEQETHGGEGGLLMRRFVKNSPYEGEDLFVSTPDERLFSARCPSPGAGKTSDELCIWQTRIGNLEVHTRFARRLLQEWAGIAQGVRTTVPRIAARPAK